MTKYGQSVISRETRLLLITILVSLTALWLLARIRFQDRAVTVAPVPPVLAQLRPQSTFDDLAQSLSDLRPGIAAAIAATDTGRPAFRIAETSGITLSDAGFALVTLPRADIPLIEAWAPRVIDYPRYFVAVDVMDERVSLRPVFVGSLVQHESEVWGGSIWLVPPSLNVSAGTFMFTTDGQIAGVVVQTEHRKPALMPAALLLQTADQLSSEASRTLGYSGLQPIPRSSAWRLPISTPEARPPVGRRDRHH